MYRVVMIDGAADYPWVKDLHGENVKLSSGKIVKGINGIDSFSFTISPLHPLYNSIRDYQTLIRIYNTNRRRQEFIGRVLYTNDDMSESGEIRKDVVCESFLGYLCDSVQDAKDKNHVWTGKSFLETVLLCHNGQVEKEKKITLGRISDELANIQFQSEIKRENSWEVIKKTLIDVYGGEISIRCSNFTDSIYLDYLIDEKNVSSTKIALSRNMKSVSRERDPSEIVTRLIPIGKDGLDITSVNNGRNYIEDTEAKNLFGIRYKAVEFSDVTSPEILMQSGDEWLHNNNKVRVKYTVTALDLSLLGLDIDDFEVKNYHPLVNPLLGIDDTARIIKKTIDICEEVKSSFEIGDNFESVSDIQIRRAKEINKLSNALASDYATIEDVENAEALVEAEAERAKSVETNLKANQDNIVASVETQGEYLSQLVIDQSGISAEVSNIKGDISTLTQTVNGFETRVENAEGAVSTLTQTVNGFETRVDTQGEYITTLIQTTNSIESKVETAEDNISALSVRVNQIAASVGDGITSADLALTIENGVAKISASADKIALTTGEITITGDWFTLNAQGGLTAQYATLEECKVTSIANGATATLNNGIFTIVKGNNEISLVNDRLELGNKGTSNHLLRIASNLIGYMPYTANEGNPYHYIQFQSTGAKLYGTWYGSASEAITSDINKKNSIVDIKAEYSTLFDNLTPRLYKYNDGTSDRYHVGFIAQEVEAAINAAGLTTQDFAGFVRADLEDLETGEHEEVCCLRYEEFIALCVHEIQSLKKEIGELKNNG